MPISEADLLKAIEAIEAQAGRDRADALKAGRVFAEQLCGQANGRSSSASLLRYLFLNTTPAPASEADARKDEA